MPNEPQRDIEKELLDYKRRRRDQAGAPQELHPATRRMLQSEVARSASRPLLSSEEAAKNFVRSFAMSHQQLGFFTRHRHRLIWGGAMFAGLMLVMAVLRNDPRQQEQARAFSDALPAPPAAPAPMPVTAASRAPAEADRFRLATGREPASKEGGEVLARESVVPPRTAAPPPAALPVAAPQPASAPRAELERLGAAAAKPVPAMPAAPAKAESVVSATPLPEPSPARTESAAESKNAFGANRSRAEARVAGATASLNKALAPPAASALAGVTMAPADKKLPDLPKGQLADDFVRSSPTPATSARGSVATSAGATDMSLAAAGNAPVPPALKRFQQLDERSGYRQNFNSPPLPPVLQDFAFERTGERVRIVDSDGSTYEGTVLPEAVGDARKKAAQDPGLEVKARAATPAQGGTQAGTYWFVARGLNRKLNQSVEFRGQWQPAASPATDVPALRAARADAAQLELQTAVRKDKAAVSVITAPAGSPTQHPVSGSSPGWISGRAVVGGTSEFDLRAAPR